MRIGLAGLAQKLLEAGPISHGQLSIWRFRQTWRTVQPVRSLLIGVDSWAEFRHRQKYTTPDYILSVRFLPITECRQTCAPDVCPALDKYRNCATLMAVRVFGA